jgi:flavin reductase (DIM6/NTAB) family NADH-FMN oxidoreductase RutF
MRRDVARSTVVRQEEGVMRQEVAYTYGLDNTLERLRCGGLLVGSAHSDGRSNVMTIGWAMVGVAWGLPVVMVMVRPSRHTYTLIEDSGLFTVNVPTPAMREFVALCGSKSGRQVDKVARAASSAGQRVSCVTLDESSLVYECRVIHWNDVDPTTLAPELREKSYPGGDYHRLYYGKIEGVFA